MPARQWVRVGGDGVPLPIRDAAWMPAADPHPHQGTLPIPTGVTWNAYVPLSRLFPPYCQAAPIMLNIVIHMFTHADIADEWLRSLVGDVAFNHYLELLKELDVGVYSAAHFLCHCGLQDVAIILYESVILSGSLVPENAIQQYLQMLMFGDPDINTPEKTLNAHVALSSRFANNPLYDAWGNSLESGRRLRIGYTCHFVANSVSSQMLQPLLKAHNRDRVEVFMYSDDTGPVAEDVRAMADYWRDTAMMSAERFCSLVRADGIDILLELNGQMARHRYHEIARHPAPVQVAWYNYPNTTGVVGFDYTLVGTDIDIRHLQEWYSEEIFTKRGTSFVVPLRDNLPAVPEPPNKKNGYITFGHFGQAHKVTRNQVLFWCEVLKRVPGSKFFMKAAVLDYSENRSAFVKHFSAGGIGDDRLILEGQSPYDELLKCYERVDIALDTYPYNGGATTIEALLQGVPVLSLVGDTYASQIACAITGTSGHPELQFRKPEALISYAVWLASNPVFLEHYRKTLREDYRLSPRNDMKRFINELEDAYFEMWGRYVKTQELGIGAQSQETMEMGKSAC